MAKRINKLDVLFVYSGTPLPAMLDIVNYTHKAGLMVGVIILERGRGDLILLYSYCKTKCHNL